MLTINVNDNKGDDITEFPIGTVFKYDTDFYLRLNPPSAISNNDGYFIYAIRLSDFRWTRFNNSQTVHKCKSSILNITM